MTNRALGALIFAAAIVVGAAVAAPAPARAETPIPPAPARWVTDHAQFLSPGALAQLDARLGGYERASGHQLLVYIDRTTGGVPIEDWAVRAFEQWRVGRKGIDDGLVLFIFSDDRKLRIEVGYGLEGQVPDARAGRIIADQIVPRIRAGDRDGAVRAGVESLIAATGGAATVPPAPAAGRGAGGVWGLIILVAFVVLMGGLLRHPSAWPWLLLNIIASGRGGGRGGGWGGGGGGFSGGGGRSGGGGASGSW